MPNAKSPRSRDITEKGIQRAQQKKNSSKKKLIDAKEEARERSESAEWEVGINSRRKSKIDGQEAKKKLAEKRRREKKALEAKEEAEIQKIKQIRQMNGRSRSMGNAPESPMPRRGRSQSVDLTVSPENWKQSPRNSRQESHENTKVKLSILTMNGAETTLFLTKNSTVRDIKIRIEHVRGIPEVSQELLSPGYNSQKPLVDSQSLKDLGFRQGATIYCTNNAGTLDQWAIFQHFRSPNKPKKHVEFSEDEKTATKTATHPKATYVFTSGSVSAQRNGPSHSWEVKVNALNVRKGRIVIGLFQGRDLKLDEDPIPAPASLKKKVEWGTTTGAGQIDTQSRIWAVATDGKYKTPESTGFISMPGNDESMQQVSAGDLVRITLNPELAQLEFYISKAQPEVEPDTTPSRPETETDIRPSLDVNEFMPWYTLPLGLTAAVSNDLHLFTSLQTQKDSVTILCST